MLKGDLATTPLAPLLVQLAEDLSTGCLHIADASGEEALVYYKNGLVYAVSVPGHRPQLGAKLISSGALAPEALADALEAQRTELQGWRLGELLVHLGYVDQPVVEAFVKEQVHDALWDLIKWVDGPWKFRKNEKTREDVAPPMPVVDLLADLRERGYEWQTISKVVNGPDAVPVLSARGGGEPETTLNPDAWSMLCKIDGERTIAELARDCGYTMFEAGLVLVALVNAGLVDIDEDVEAQSETPPQDERYGASTVSSALAADAAAAVEIQGDDSFADLARLVTEVAASVRDDEPTGVAASPPVELPSPIPLNVGNDESFAASIAKVSEALADVLGPAPVTHDPFEVPTELRIKRKRAPEQRHVVTEEEARKTRTRQAAAAELAAAHALAEALRAAQQDEDRAAPAPAPVQPEAETAVAPVVDLAAVRREAEAARAVEERVAAEIAAKVEAERLEAERLEAERVAAERLAAEEAARVEAERLEAERLEAERLEAERLAAEETARLEAERLEAERLAAEEAARFEAERLEAERLAAEEAARLEAERLAAEEAARLEAERLEAERLAAEEAARLEAERLAAEEATRLEAERLAAEEAARLDAERLAAEEAARLEAERLEAERLAAEEAARLEAERLAANEAARLEAERFAAEQAARIAAERAAAEDEAWAEYWAREARAAEAKSAHGAAASALLTELSTDPVDSEPPAEELAEQQPVAEDVPPVREPATVGAPAAAMHDMADTAALLRELSSLGVDDEPTPPPTPRPAPTRAPSRAPASDKKKKRGLFGF